MAEKSEDCRSVALAKADIFSACLIFARATTRRASHEAILLGFLQSEIDAERFYTALTDDLRERFKAHNKGRVRHSSKWKPWSLKTHIAFPNRSRGAIRAIFERFGYMLP